MPIGVNGSGTITGISVGGLPDGIVDTDMLAANAVTNAKKADEYSSGAINIGGIRIVTGSYTTSSSSNDAGTSYGTSVRYYISSTNNNIYSGFASTPSVFASLDSDYHDVQVSNVNAVSTTSFTTVVAGSRTGGIQSKTIRWVAIGEAS